MRHSLYWDDFTRRADETVGCVDNGMAPPVRRVAIFITEGCNFKCDYCNVKQKPTTLTQAQFMEVVEKYGDTAILHITGGEPSIVPWLYPIIRAHGNKYRFHLNTNAYKMPPASYIRRLKVSLDGDNPEAWDKLVGVTGAWDRVVKNIQRASLLTTTSVTYTLTRENYRRAPRFIRSAQILFPHLYAQFFSVYKGTNPRFVFTDEDIDIFFNDIIPVMKEELDEESLALLCETMSNKQRLIAGVRFPDNNLNEPCYLSMSERVIAPDGTESFCSHLYRDGIKYAKPDKCEKCQYGCNQRLVDFNNIVSGRLSR
jgi:MoaA/NifB/PqqE/SkfB family radical SAM enzyme